MRAHRTISRASQIRACACIIAAVAMSGCDSSYGLTRTAEIQSMPSSDCVLHAIESAPGVTGVQRQKPEDSRSLLGPVHSVSNFTYHGSEGSHIRGALQLIERDNGEMHLTQSLVAINVAPPQDEIDATRPVMQHIEQTIASECGIPSLPSFIRENCRGVNCSPDPD